MKEVLGEGVGWKGEGLGKVGIERYFYIFCVLLKF